MRIVLDTNILISAIFFGGLPRLALQMSMQEPRVLITSPVLIEEFKRVLIDRFGVPLAGAENILIEYQRTAKLVHPKTRLNIVTNDPSDNRILECAVEGKADAIVSGDRHLLALKIFRGIPIVTVREFIRLIHRD